MSEIKSTEPILLEKPTQSNDSVDRVPLPYNKQKEITFDQYMDQDYYIQPTITEKLVSSWNQTNPLIILNCGVVLFLCIIGFILLLKKISSLRKSTNNHYDKISSHPLFSKPASYYILFYWLLSLIAFSFVLPVTLFTKSSLIILLFLAPSLVISMLITIRIMPSVSKSLSEKFNIKFD